jgi:hypothetical protein
VANYCNRGLARELAEWWAPNKILQQKKDIALDKVYEDAQNYIKFTST